jgi:riboflavin synthase
MFTGIVEKNGTVLAIEPSAKSIRLTLRADFPARSIAIGDSIAVNGCCLTATRIRKAGKGVELAFDLLNETWQRTNFKALAPGALVNLERSLKIGDRLHGHFVTGHIDGTGAIQVFEKRGADWLLEIKPPKELLRYIVSKGSIAVDGISLTVAEVSKTAFRIWIIPHTYDVTALRERKASSLVNLEADMLAKYAEKMFRSS